MSAAQTDTAVPGDKPVQADRPAVPDMPEEPADMSGQAADMRAVDKQAAGKQVPVDMPELAGKRVPAGKSAAESVPAAARRYHR